MKEKQVFAQQIYSEQAIAAILRSMCADGKQATIEQIIFKAKELKDKGIDTSIAIVGTAAGYFSDTIDSSLNVYELAGDIKLTPIGPTSHPTVENSRITLTESGKRTADEIIFMAYAHNKKAAQKMLNLLGLKMDVVKEELAGMLLVENKKLEVDKREVLAKAAKRSS